MKRYLAKGCSGSNTYGIGSISYLTFKFKCHLGFYLRTELVPITDPSV